MRESPGLRSRWRRRALRWCRRTELRSSWPRILAAKIATRYAPLRENERREADQHARFSTPPGWLAEGQHSPKIPAGDFRLSKRVMARRRLDRDPTQLGELVDPGLAAEAAVAGRFHAAEGHLRLIVDRRTVDVADPRLDALRQLQCAADIFAENRRGQAVLGVVRQLHRLIGGLHAGDRHLRPEGLLAEQSHLRRDPVDDDPFH